MSRSYWVFVTAIYPDEKIAEERFKALDGQFSKTHLTLKETTIEGEIPIESSYIEKSTHELKEILKKDCDEGYLDTYEFNHTRYLNEENEE